MHIRCTHQISMTGKLAGVARPISVLGLMEVSTIGTPARCASFRASEARYVDGSTFVGEVINVLAIFPQSHTLIMVPAFVLVADPMRITNEEGPNLLLHTKIDHFAGRFVSQVTNTSLGTTALLVFGSLQPLPAAGILCTPGLLFGKLSQLLASLMFERTNAAPGHDHSGPHVGSHGSQVDFAQINRRVIGTWSLLCLGNFYAHMQFKSTIPDQDTSCALFWKVERQTNGLASSTHWQKHPSWLDAHGLSRPEDRIKPLGPPGIFHMHLWMHMAKFSGRLDGGKKGMDDHLNRLTMQGKATFGGLLQVLASRPSRVVKTCLLVHFHTAIPDLGSFHLSRFQEPELLVRQMIQLIYFDCLHRNMISEKNGIDK